MPLAVVTASCRVAEADDGLPPVRIEGYSRTGELLRHRYHLTMSSRLSLVVVSSALVLAALPLFMVGGLAVQIRAELGLTEAALGAAVTAGFVVGALSAPLGGRIADRIGPRTAVYVGGTLSTLSLVGLGVMVDSWAGMALFLSLAGLAVAVTDPGLAILVKESVTEDAHGLAFGLKEASIPAATLLAGAAVPAVALTVGWRWAFAVGLVPLFVVVSLLRKVTLRRSDVSRNPNSNQSTEGSPSRAPTRAIALTAIAAALGTTAASGVGVFLTESAVAMGMSPGAAGVLLAVGSVAGIVTRVGTGLTADRWGGVQFRLIAGMLAVGGVAIALGGSGNNLLLVLGTIGAFTGGWGWTGLYFLSLVKSSPSNPGAVAGIGTAGLGVGNAAGPVLFGLTAQTVSFRAAWLVAGLIAGLASLVMLAARRQMTP